MAFSFFGGVHPKDNKHRTRDLAVQRFPAPDVLVVSMSQHICPNEAITVTNNLAVIDYTKCDNCGLCATVCPKHLIKDSKVETLPDTGLVHSRNNPDAVL